MNDEFRRHICPISRAENTLGTIAALVILQQEKLIEKKYKQKIVAEYIKDDAHYGNHVRITTVHQEGENAGGRSSRNVIIHNAPEGELKHTVRFIDFTVVIEFRTYDVNNVAELSIDALCHLITGDPEQDLPG